MKKVKTSDRLKEIMSRRGLRQVDILKKAKPFCEKNGVKLNKSDLSQYISGVTEPRQEKLEILGKTLNVSDLWLLGYDVEMDRNSGSDRILAYSKKINDSNMPLGLSALEYQIILNYRIADSFDKANVLRILKIEDAIEELKKTYNNYGL
ncbi:MAG: transcriptional regulator [Clostridiales bacterium]|nr:transcriptional regulator [Clostridiales bacterium]